VIDSIGDVQFRPGSKFKLGEFPVSFIHCLSLERVVVSDTTSDEMRVVTRTELVEILTEKLPPLPCAQLDVTVASVDSAVEFEVLE
jgi:hypothetical protein